MVKAGVLVRRGRFWFGRAGDVDEFLLGKWAQKPARGAR